MDARLIAIVAGALTAAYVAGRYSAPEKIKIETVTVTKEVVIQDESAKLRQTQRIVETTRPDGTTVKETRIRTRAESERETHASRDTTNKESKEIENRRGVAANVLIGLPLAEVARGPVVGAALSKQFIGPFTLGVWGLSNLTFGFTVGVEL
jgi:CRISPR/Cas system-associated endonuclease Cas3-HD